MSASCVQVGETLIALQSTLMYDHPLVEAGCFRGLMLRKVMLMQQLFEVNVKVRGRQSCVKILKLGD